MRLHNLAIALAVAGLFAAFTATPARADQINLGNNTCTGGPVAVSSTPSMTGAAFSCSDDTSFSSIHGNQGNFDWSLTPGGTGTTATISIQPCAVAASTCTTTDWDITGTATWTSGTYIGGSTNAFVLDGNFLVTGISGTNPANPWYGDYVVGSSYGMDLILQGCTQTGGGYSCTSPSSGEIIAGEPSALTMLAMGLLAVCLAGGFLRRREVSVA